ncbi:MAG: RNHCP domain-containing protein [Defluviitaleaceae bacterium]|nr:RNHCP domain-containing protein [Defluviitaleaceae bacterium]
MVNKYSSRDKDKHKYNNELSMIDRSHATTNYRNEPCNESFTCKNCSEFVLPECAATKHRNHCPKCLVSIHVDINPGDRASMCGGNMEPISVWVRKNGEWAIIHRCRTCGEISSNRIAADDNPTLLMSIAVKPLAMPPFPLGML